MTYQATPSRTRTGADKIVKRAKAQAAQEDPKKVGLENEELKMLI